MSVDTSAPMWPGSRRRTVEIHPHDDDERYLIGADAKDDERAGFLAALLEACPELRRHDSQREAEATASVLVGFMGRMSYTEIGEVMGTSRQRAEQITLNALRKMKLAGGPELREAWEHVEARDDWTTWDYVEAEGVDL